MWDRIAFVTRYGHQSVAEVMGWPSGRGWSVGMMEGYTAALSRRLARDNAPDEET